MSKKGKRNKPPYTGELATPIYEPIPVGPGGLGGERAEAEHRAFERLILKFDELFHWYSIDPEEPSAGIELAAILALAHIPGMQVLYEPPKQRGRKRTWKNGLDRELLRDVDTLRQTKEMNYEQAIEELQKDEMKPWRNYSRPNLITRHREARKAEQHRRRLTEQLKASPISQAMGAVLGVGLTDENSSDQN
ncbi:hypothetical protein Q2941_16660 [Bradyrhizobium sp. UFLA05-153]